MGTVNFIWSKTAATNTGSNALAGNLSWGRDTVIDQVTFATGPAAGSALSGTTYHHWATGDCEFCGTADQRYIFLYLGGRH